MITTQISRTYLLAALLLLLVGCSRSPQTGRLDTGSCEQVFLPRFIAQDDGSLNCQWVEFHRDSIGGAGATWNPAAQTFDSTRGYGFIERQYVVCVPELVRWTNREHGTATFVAHSCIQECFMVWQDSLGKREAAWLAAPAVQTYPLKVDSLFVVLHESSTEDGLIVVWMDRRGRELSRDTLALPGPDHAAAVGGGVTMVKGYDDHFTIYHIGRACSWVDSAIVQRAYTARASLGTDYFVQDGELVMVSGYAPTRDAVEFETFYIAGAKVQSHHTASAELRGGEPYVACRAVATGGEFPLIVALAQSAEGRELVLLAQNSEGAWALEASAAVEPTIQEFCAAESGEDILVAYTAATEQSAAVNSCRWLRFQY